MINFRLRAKIYYSDGSITASHLVMNINTLQVGEIATIPAGMEQLNLAALNPSKTITAYELWVENTSNVKVINNIFFEVEDETPFDQYFLYENGLGRWETVKTSSSISHKVIVEKEVYEKLLRYGSTLHAKDAHQYASQRKGVQQEFEAQSGYLEKSEVPAFVDFLNAEHIYKMEGTTKIPILIDKAAIVISNGRDDEGDFEYNFSFKYTFAQSDINYSKL
jgi:hypothetical protein